MFGLDRDEFRLHLQEHLASVFVLIIDELSMESCQLLGDTDKCFRIGKDKPDLLFGGVHIICLGDFYQLPPVNGIKLFVDHLKSVNIANRNCKVDWLIYRLPLLSSSFIIIELPI